MPFNMSYDAVRKEIECITNKKELWTLEGTTGVISGIIIPKDVDIDDILSLKIFMRVRYDTEEHAEILNIPMPILKRVGRIKKISSGTFIIIPYSDICKVSSISKWNYILRFTLELIKDAYFLIESSVFFKYRLIGYDIYYDPHIKLPSAAQPQVITLCTYHTMEIKASNHISEIPLKLPIPCLEFYIKTSKKITLLEIKRDKRVLSI